VAKGRKNHLSILQVPNLNKRLKRSKNKRGALLSKTEAKSSNPLGLSNWQKNKLQKLSAQELRKKGMS
jgi:hypothetical protein